MSWYVLPAILALIIKLVIVVFAYRNWDQSKLFFGLVLLFAAQNISEVASFVNFVNQTTTDFTLRSYYVCTFGVMAFICCYAIEISKLKRLLQLTTVHYLFSIIAILMVIFTDSIIAGYQHIGYSITRIAGNYYVILQIYALFTFVFSVTVFVIGYKKAKSSVIAVQNIYSLLALMPILIAGGVVILLMAMGYKINAVVIFPVASTLFLLIMLKTEVRHNLTDIRQLLPYSLERRTTNKILGLMSDYAMDERSYRDAMHEIEAEIVKYKHIKLGYNVSKTAEAMDIPRSSLYSIFRRLGVSNPENKVGKQRKKDKSI